jgi:hypothetical protein
MTASDEQTAAAAKAVQLGMQTAEQYWQAAAANPGVGVEVHLPSWPGPAGPTKGLSYETPGEPAPMPGNPSLKLVPDYASDIVGGAIHHGSPASRTEWPANTTVSTIFPRSSVQYVPASSRQTWRSRLREAWSALLGR